MEGINGIRNADVRHVTRGPVENVFMRSNPNSDAYGLVGTSADGTASAAEHAYAKFHIYVFSTIWMFVANMVTETLRSGIGLLSLALFAAAGGTFAPTTGTGAVIWVFGVMFPLMMAVRLFWSQFSSASGPQHQLVLILSGRYSAKGWSAIILGMLALGAQLVGSVLGALLSKHALQKTGVALASLPTSDGGFGAIEFQGPMIFFWGIGFFGFYLLEWKAHQYFDVNSHAFLSKPVTKRGFIDYGLITFLGSLALTLFECMIALVMSAANQITYPFYWINFAYHVIFDKVVPSNKLVTFGSGFFAAGIGIGLFIVARFVIFNTPKVEWNALTRRGDYEGDEGTRHVALYGSKVRSH